MSNLLNSLSNFIFSGRKREREEVVKGDKDIDELNWKENIINSIKMRKTMTKVNTRINAYNNNNNSKRVNDINEDKSAFCPRCSNKKYDNIYLHLHENNNTNDNDNNGNQDKPLVRTIDFNNETGGSSKKVIEDITNEKAEMHNESNKDSSDNQSKHEPNITDEEAKDNIKEDEVIRDSHIIPNPKTITNAIQRKVFQFKVSKPSKVYEENGNDVIDDYQPEQRPIHNKTPIKKKIFLDTTLLYLPIPKWQIELKYNQLIKDIQTEKNYSIITKFTQKEFITCYESMKGFIINNALPINSNSFRTLSNNLNEEVIDYYLCLIQKRNEAKYKNKSHIFNCDVFNSIAINNQLTDLDAVDLNLCDVLIIPIKCNSNVNIDHYDDDNDNEDEDTNYYWCLALIDIPFNEIVYYDLLYNSIELFNKNMKSITNALSAYPLTKDRTFTLNQVNIPIQNGNDSGVILCQLVNHITSQRNIDFTHTDIENLRYLMGIEILKGEILF